jgi:hypothetical protein
MVRRTSAIACIMFGALGCATSETEAPSAPSDTGAASARQAFKQTAAARAAAVLSDPVTRAAVLDELRQRGPSALTEIPALAAMDRGYAEQGAVPEAWLYEPAGARSADLVVAYAPAGSERSWTEVPAYTLAGTRIALDARQAPGFPVLVIETHGRLAMHQGIAAANAALQTAGLQPSAPRFSQATSTATAARWTTKLASIRLADDEEPWISGTAEIYAVVSGVVGDNAPALKIVELPYLDYDGTTYTPNQIILDWNDYAYQAANIQLFEHDDSTNYQQLVTALITAVGGVGSLAGYPVVQAISEIANRIIAAMPAGWFANDDDYVDSFYTVEKTVSYNGLVGAGGNATVSLQPFLLAPNE